MSSKEVELALRKQRLQLQCAVERTQMVKYVDGLTPVWHIADGVAATGAWLRRHPLPVVALLAALTVMRPRIVWRWSLRAWGLWRIIGSLRSTSASVPPVNARALSTVLSLATNLASRFRRTS